MKTAKKLTALVLCAVLMLPLLQSCGAPDLSEVKDEFTALIEASFEINDIFFGQGLEVYDRETSSGSDYASYDENSLTYYWLLEDATYGQVLKFYPTAEKKYYYAAEKTADTAVTSSGITVDGKNVYLVTADGTRKFELLDSYKETEKEYVYGDDAPEYYDYVRLDEKYQTISSIKEAAEKVYSSDYLESIYSVMFDGIMTDDQIVYARYMNDESGDTDFLLKSNKFTPYFETQTTYDYSTMKIVSPSDAESVNVSITATGRYIDNSGDDAEIKTGEFTKNLRFVKDGDGWRLDTPTY